MLTAQQVLDKFTDKYIRWNTDVYLGTIMLQTEELQLLVEMARQYKAQEALRLVRGEV